MVDISRTSSFRVLVPQHDREKNSAGDAAVRRARRPAAAGAVDAQYEEGRSYYLQVLKSPYYRPTHKL